MSSQQRSEWVSAEILRRHEEVCHDYFDLGLPEKEVTRRSGYAAPTVSLIIKKEAARNPERAANRKPIRYDRRKMIERKPISAAHVKLGLLVSRFQASHKLRLIELSMLFNLSRPTVSQIITGSYDIALSELQFICKFLNVPIEEIFKGMHNGPIYSTSPESHRFASRLHADNPVQPVPDQAGVGGVSAAGPRLDHLQAGGTANAGPLQGDAQ